MSLDGWLQANRISSEDFIADLHRQANDVARESLALDALARELKVAVSYTHLVAAGGGDSTPAFRREQVAARLALTSRRLDSAGSPHGLKAAMPAIVA